MMWLLSCMAGSTVAESGPIAISATSHTLDCTSSASCRLTVHWRIENPGPDSLYVLVNLPIMTTAGEPLVLDHTLSPYTTSANVNQAPKFHIETVRPHAAWSGSMTYAINASSTRVVGRFGVSHQAPDPSWEAQQQWPPLKTWLQPADSAPFHISRE